MRLLFSNLFALAFSFGLLTSCSKSDVRYGIDPTSERQAPAAIAESFQSKKVVEKAHDTQNVDTAHVVISKLALEKEFLFSANILAQQPTPMFQSLQSRVVYFTRKDSVVILLESAPGRAVGQNNPTQFLPIAKFEILSETELDLTIDFNKGMQTIITVSDMFSSDDSQTAATNGWTSAIVNFSYLQSVQVVENQFFIQQVAQVIKADKIVPMEIRYYLTPYAPDKTFIPTRSPGFEQVGYFEANPLLDSHGNSLVYAMKWNTNKPIQFALSANTPQEYKETVRNGVLYWNKILGENKIQVIELTDAAVTAPNAFYNVIQWVDWDSAGYAYADAHVDPRSGEVTHAQVFFPSAFTHAAVEKRVRVLAGSALLRTQFGLNGFKSAQVCRRDLLHDFQQSIAAETPAISKESLQKAIKDYVFEVIAHEVGHVLGLRHNFAGNLIANYDMSDRRELALSYYHNMKAPAGIVASSSVMEYSRFEESSWNGDLLQHGAPALAYDQVAMDHLYNGKEIPAHSPLFCTDSQIVKYADCNMSDAARSTVSYAVGNYNYSLQSVPAKVLNQFVSEVKIPDAPGVPIKPIKNVLLSPAAFAHLIALDRYKLMSLLKDEVRLIQVRGPLFPIWPSTNDKVLSLEKDFVASEINRLGGLKKILNLAESTIDQVWIARFTELLNDPAYSQGIAGDQKYDFSTEEKQIMSAQFATFAVELKMELIKNNLKALAAENVSFEETYGQSKLEATKGWFDHPITDELASVVKTVADFYLFSKDSVKSTMPIVFQNGSFNSVELPTYTYNQEIRALAVNVWQAPHVAIDWGYVEKQQTTEQLRSETSLIVDAVNIDFTKTNKFVLKWLLSNQELIKKLN